MTMEKDVRVRFAPSPTGYLHVGGARTAIYNWLFARRHNGHFILRIEDTDAERSTESSIHGIVEGLRWLGLDWDEGPYFQSDHIREHVEAAARLVESGHAYKCFCSRDVLEKKRDDARPAKADYRYDGACRNLTPDEIEANEKAGMPFVIRLKAPRNGGAVVFEDEVYGVIEKKHADIEDFVIVRSNGQPLYILSNTVDDIRDRITHVIRGADGLSNTPKQVLIYTALGEVLPSFAHMSLALDPDKAKISKRRHGERVAVQYYRERGFIPWALVNFLVLLGWSTPESREFFSRKELIDVFSLKGISRNNPVFDIPPEGSKHFTDPKAISMNAHYLRTLPVDEILPLVRGALEKDSLWDNAWDHERKAWFRETVDLIRSRFHLTTDFTTLGRAYFTDDYRPDPAAVAKHLHAHPNLKHLLPELADDLEHMAEFGEEPLEQLLRSRAEKRSIKVGVLVNGMRVAATGQAVGPEFLKSMTVLGRDAVIRRLRRVGALYAVAEKGEMMT